MYVAFMWEFRGHMNMQEKAGNTLFTPHYINWFCPVEFQGTPSTKARTAHNT
jgi:hypothetical protein